MVDDLRSKLSKIGVRDVEQNKFLINYVRLVALQKGLYRAFTRVRAIAFFRLRSANPKERVLWLVKKLESTLKARDYEARLKKLSFNRLNDRSGFEKFRTAKLLTMVFLKFQNNLKLAQLQSIKTLRCNSKRLDALRRGSLFLRAAVQSIERAHLVAGLRALSKLSSDAVKQNLKKEELAKEKLVDQNRRLQERISAEAQAKEREKEEISRFIKVTKRLEEENRILKGGLQQEIEKVRTAEFENEKLKTETSKFIEALQKSSDGINQLRRELERQVSENKNLSSQLEEAERLKEGARSKTESIHDKYKELKQKCSDLKSENSALVSSNERLQDSLTRLQEEMTQIHYSSKEREKESKMSSKELAATKVSLNQEREKAERLTSQNAILIDEKKASQIKFESLFHENEVLRQMILQKEKEYVEVRRNVETSVSKEYREEIENLKAINHRINKDKMGLLKENALIKEQASIAQEDMKSLREKVKELEEALSRASAAAEKHSSPIIDVSDTSSILKPQRTLPPQTVLAPSYRQAKSPATGNFIKDEIFIEEHKTKYYDDNDDILQKVSEIQSKYDLKK